MVSKSHLAFGAAAGAAALLVSVLPAGAAQAAGTGTALEGTALGGCKVEFQLTNHTNSTFFQPDWWFASEGTGADGGTPPSAPPPYSAPWREVPSTGTNWAWARWIGDPPLHSGLADGVPSWGNGVPYKSNAQPDGFITKATIDVSAATGPVPPTPSETGKYTIWFRIGNGPQTADRVAPKSLEVTGCPQSNGGSSGSSSGSLGSSSGSLGLGSLIG